jgi:hypothetical protein
MDSSLVLRRMFRMKEEEVTEAWRELHNEELCNFYSSPNITRMIKSRRISGWRLCSTYGGEEVCIIGHWWESQREKDHWHRWVDNVDMDLGGVQWGGTDCINPAQNGEWWRAFMNMEINFWVPYNVGEFISTCTIGSFSRTAQLREVY